METLDPISPPWVDSWTVDSLPKDLRAWLQSQMVERNLVYLLAHTEDGVIWGTLIEGQLVTSREAARDLVEYGDVSPELEALTLLQLRAFGPKAELLLWRDDMGWKARLIDDTELSDNALALGTYDESYLLWGNIATAADYGFTALRDGSQGFRHIIPLPNLPRQALPVRLRVRHYLRDDENTGFTRIVTSRLVDLELSDGTHATR